MTVKFINAKEAASMIPDGSTVAIDAFISFCLADDILGEIESRFVREGHPSSLSVVNVAGIGGAAVYARVDECLHADFCDDPGLS